MPLRVGPTGPHTAPICFIGEAPGADEVRQMRPFVGPAGMELTRLLTQAGISRSECYLTNVVKERPPGNNIKAFIDLSRRAPVHTKEYDAYELELYSELEKLEANVYVPLGNIPLYALTRRKGITKWRGSILSASVLGKAIKVIPTIHPAALLPGRGQYIWRYFVLHDLHRVLLESKSPEVDLPDYELVLRPTFAEAMAYIDACRDTELVAVDIEVINEEVSCISLSTSSDSSISIPFTEDRENYFTEGEELAIWRA
ncbi:MAG: uracil-DNA glycosylase, partial [Desulfatiglandaceae bacterium]